MSYDWKVPKNPWRKIPKPLNDFELEYEWRELRYLTQSRYAENEYDYKKKHYPDMILLFKEFWFHLYMPKKFN